MRAEVVTFVGRLTVVIVVGGGGDLLQQCCAKTTTGYQMQLEGRTIKRFYLTIMPIVEEECN